MKGFRGWKVILPKQYKMKKSFQFSAAKSSLLFMACSMRPVIATAQNIPCFPFHVCLNMGILTHFWVVLSRSCPWIETRQWDLRNVQKRWLKLKTFKDSFSLRVFMKNNYPVWYFFMQNKHWKLIKKRKMGAWFYKS